jgi:rhomboid protease GluP
MRKIVDNRLFALLVIVNVVIFVLMWIQSGHDSSDSALLIQWGANTAPLTLTGQPWRLLTSAFLHAGWLHLLANMYMLVLLGGVLERLIGSLRFAVIYLLSAIGGSLASAYWQSLHASDVIGIGLGASGALMGLAGAALAITFAHREPWPTGATVRLKGSAIAQVIVINIAFGLTTRGIDNAAHVGGVVTGFIVGWLLCQGDPTENFFRRVGLPLIVLVVGGAGLTALSFDRTDTLMDAKASMQAAQDDAAAEKSQAEAEQQAQAALEKDHQPEIKAQQAIDQMAKEDERTRPAPATEDRAGGRKVLLNGWPTFFTIGASGQYAYVTDFAGNALNVVDLDKLAVVRTVQGPVFATGAHAVDRNDQDGRGALGVAVSQDEHTAWVASMQKDSVVRVDLVQSKVIDAAKVGHFPSDVVLSPGGDKLYVLNVAQGNQDDTISVVSVPRWPQVLATLKLPSPMVGIDITNHRDMWFSKDGKQLFVPARNPVIVYEFDTQDFHLIRMLGSNELSNRYVRHTQGTAGIWLGDGKDKFGWADPESMAIRQDYSLCDPQASFFASDRDGKLIAVSDDAQDTSKKTMTLRVVKTATRRSIGAYPVRIGVVEALFGKDPNVLYVLSAPAGSHSQAVFTTLHVDQYVAPEVDAKSDYLCQAWPLPDTADQDGSTTQ